MSIFPKVDVRTVEKDGKTYYVDTFRKRLTLATPEEEVRQSVLRYMVDKCGVPEDMLLVEAPMCHFERGKRGRADIVVIANSGEFNGAPVAIIECKSRSVPLTERAFDQAVPYCDATGADILIATNGDTAYVTLYDWDDGTWHNMDGVPSYQSMCDGNHLVLVPAEKQPWVPIENPEAKIKEFTEQGFLGENTPKDLAAFGVKFIDSMRNAEGPAPGERIGNIVVEKDFGTIEWDFGSSTRGFWGFYRSLQVNYRGEVKFIYIDESNYSNITHPELTSIHFGSHGTGEPGMDLHCLLENDLTVEEDSYLLTHSGQIKQTGKKGLRKKLLEVMQERRPDLLMDNGRIFIGRLPKNKVWTFETLEFREMVANLIEYGLIRAELRGRG